MELFSGVGGWSLGAWLAGWEFDNHYYSEVDRYASAVFQKRFPDAVPLGDVRGVHKEGLPDGDWYLAGGFPCQDVSISGRKVGLELGEKSSLWFEFARIIGEFRPRFALVENVGNLTGKGLHRVLSDLFEAGYDAEWFDIRASDVGAPHRRERLWIVAYPQGVRFGGRSGCGSDDGKIFHSEREETFGAFRPVVVEGSGNGSEAVADSLGARQSARERRRGANQDVAKVDLFRGEFGGAWSSESRVSPVADGVPHWVDRIRCSGNALLPQIAELIWDAVGELDDFMIIPGR
jgi:DNA (cytosine-5)-methyltransferase 1